jgi:hypothetical protein
MVSVGDVLRDLNTLLRRQAIAWYVFGAQAVVVFGRPRQTVDIDVTVDVAMDDVPALADSLKDAGYVARVDDLTEFARRTRAAPLIHEGSGIPVDVILAGPGLEREFLQRVVEVRIVDESVPFISPEDLIAVKVLAGRAKDLDDVRGIVEKQGQTLDESRIRDVLVRLEQALDRSDLLKVYESIRQP